MSKSLLVILLVILSGCSTQLAQKVSYYLLNSATSNNQMKVTKNTAQVIALKEVRLADYLKQTNLVMQLDNHQLYYSKQHFWAESLQTGIQKAILTDLNSQSTGISFIDALSPAAKKPKATINIAIEHFVTTQDSSVILIGQYWLDADQPNDIHQLQHFHYTTELREDGYPHSVKKLRGLLKRLSGDILNHSKLDEAS